MKDSKNIAIAILCVSATILASAIFLTSTPAGANGPSIRGGDYIMVNGSYSNSLDLIYIIDTSQQKMLVYAVDAIQNRIELKDQLLLKQEFKP